MHDPMTVAFDIPNPLWWRRDYNDRWRMETFATIWHVDPETDGSDDSCGWGHPKLTAKQRDVIGHLAYTEAHQPWFQRDPVKRISSAADAESLMRGAIQMVAFSLRIRLGWQETCELASRLTHNSIDNFQGSLSHLPGWHTNCPDDQVSEREYCAKGFFSSIASVILRHKRPWYRHPRWHFWHWKLQVHVLGTFKRWAFSRCSRCGKRFSWGYSPVTNNWNSSGPRWFRSETDVYHADCESPESCGAVNERQS